MNPADFTPGRSDHRDKRSALDWPAKTGQTDAVLYELAVLADRRRRRRRRRLAWGGSLAAAALAIVGGFRFSPSEPSWPAASQIAGQTVVRRPDFQVLSDGTRVELRDQAVIEPVFTAEVRRINLTRGDAHFQVAKDSSRPFVVKAGGIEVRAVGTAFFVQQTADTVEIVVTEGLVAVDQPASADRAQSQTMAMVEAGHRAVIGTGGDNVEVTSVEADELSARLVWRVPRFEFSGTSLGEVLPLFNEHNTMQLILADQALASVRLSGIIRADNVGSLLRLLEDNYGIHAERRGEVEIRLHASR